MKLDIGLEPVFSREEIFISVSDAVKDYAESVETTSTEM